MSIDIDFDLPIFETIAKLDTVWVTHGSWDRALKGLAECISWSAKSLEPKGAVLTGLGGAGKTTICKQILKALPVKTIVEGDVAIRAVPAFYTTVPAPSSIRSLASNMLEELGDPAPNRGIAKDLTSRLIKLLKQCKTRVILLDEFHHLLPAKGAVTESKMKEICQWLKVLMNSTNVMICLVGRPECSSLVDYDEEVFRRFAHHFPLDDLSCGSPEKPGPLVGFVRVLVNRYIEVVDLKGFPIFSDYDSYLRLWVATKGRPSYITLLIQTAIKIALHEANRNYVVIEDLAEAYERGITKPVTKFKGNPFRMPTDQLKQILMAKAA
jgi:hypothetical protein